MIKKIKRSSSKNGGKKVDDKTLLDVARGVKPPSEVTQKHWTPLPPNGMDAVFYRREARRAIYAILRHWKFGWDFQDNPKLVEMYDLINKQLDPNKQLNWLDFTHKWDLHPNDPTKIVFEEHWVREGGGWDLDTGMPYPTAFTKQEHN